MINGDQIRSARALLGWSAKVLALRAQVGVSTVLRLERSHSVLRGRCENVDRIEKALRAGGVSFLNDENGVGVRFAGLQSGSAPRPKVSTTELADRRDETNAEPQPRAAVR
jgi:transcriptional regulator with XRE-family HTH domain